MNDPDFKLHFEITSTTGMSPGQRDAWGRGGAAVGTRVPTKIAFGVRSLGDIGRDIIAAKYALGQVVSISQVTTGASGRQDDSLGPGAGWFDCLTGQAISIKKTATFDKAFQATLMRYQVEKQFLIMLYYFFKYGVRDLLKKQNDVPVTNNGREDVANAIMTVTSAGRDPKHRGFPTLTEELILAELTSIKLLFDMEFGHLGEATLALLHGWSPRSEFMNEGYRHPTIEPQSWLTSGPSGGWPRDELQRDLLLEIIPGELYNMYREGIYGKSNAAYPEISIPKPEDLKLAPDPYYRNPVHIAMFQIQCPGEFNWISEQSRSEFIADRQRLNPGTSTFQAVLNYVVENTEQADFNWGAVFFRQKIERYESNLYQAVNHVVATLKEDEANTPIDEVSPAERLRLLEKAFEPDPLSVSDPFIMNLKKIGFFYRTEYTLSADNLPPDPEDPTNAQIIQNLEDSALTEVLDFYERPDLWFHSTGAPEFQKQYHFVGAPPFEPGPDHGRYYPTFIATGDRLRYWVLSTNKNILGDYFPNRSAQHYSVIEGFNGEEPLIKFIDFRTPSLRPGDVYRAYFEINKSKLDIIIDGEYIVSAHAPQASAAGETPSQQLEETTDNLDACLEDPALTEQESSALLAEYRAHTAKRRREANRELRSRTAEYYRKEEIQNSFKVDGGVFGTVNLSDEKYSQAVARETIRAARGLSEIWAPSEDLGLDSATNQLLAGKESAEGIDKQLAQHRKDFPNLLKITFPVLKAAIKQAAENLNQAASESDEDGIEYSPKDFNLRKEAAYLRDLEPQLRSLVKLRIPNFVFNQDQLKPGDAPFRLIEDSGGSNGITIEFMDVTNEDRAEGEEGFTESRYGKQIKKIYSTLTQGPARGHTPAIIFDRDKAGKLGQVPKNWDSRPRTMAYLVNIKKMGYTDQGFLDALTAGNKSSCKEIGLGKRGASYATKYTAGIRVKSKASYWNPVSQWWDKKVADPVTDWKSKSLKGLGSSLRDRSYSGEVLPMLGENCSKEQLYKEFLDKIDLASILCDYIKCIKLPGFNIKIPNFNIPPIPDLAGIFGFYPYMIDELLEKWEEILTRLLCTLVRALLEMLTIPWCEDQLKDLLYGAGMGSSPAIQSAVTNAFEKMEVDEVENTKKFVDDATKLLTPRELCRLLSGESVNESVYEILGNIASLDPRLGEKMGSKDGLSNFFSAVGQFVDVALCQRLEEIDHIVGAASCEETVSQLNQVRNKITSSGDVPPEELQRVLDLAEKNLMDKAKAFEILGEDGLGSLMPPAFELDNDNALINKLPAPLEESIISTGRALFETAKTNHIMSLERFKTNLFLTIPKAPDARDKGFPEGPLLVLEAAAQTLRTFARFTGRHNLKRIGNLRTAVAILYSTYETEEVEYEPGAMLKPAKTHTVNKKQANQGGLRISLSYVNTLTYPFPDSLELITVTSGDRMVLDWDAMGSIEKFHLGDSKETFWTFDGNNRENFSKLFNINNKNKPALLKKIKFRIEELKDIIEENMEIALKPQPVSELLPLFREIFSKFREDEAEGDPRRQYIRINGGLEAIQPPSLSDIGAEAIAFTESGGSQETLELRLPRAARFEASLKYKEYAGPHSRISIDVNDQYFMGSQRNFEFCMDTPEEYRDDLNRNPNLFSKRHVFAKHYMKKMQGYLDRYGKNLENISNFSRPGTYGDLYGQIYKKSLEGILEQIFFKVENSRLFDEEYVDKIAPIIAGQAFPTETGCDENRFSLSHYGILSFDEMVTNELAEEVKKELKKPENRPENMDYNSPGPIEKGIQATALRGYIRISLIEFLLKGALTYPIWDIAGVIEDPFFKEYVIEFVTNQIYNNETLADDLGLLDRTLERIVPNTPGSPPLRSTSTSPTLATNPALRRIIEIELQRLPALSKEIFLNSDINYKEYYINSSITHTHISRDYDEETQLWSLPDAVSVRNYNDPFLFMESYLHLHGDIANLSNIEIATPSEFFAENAEELTQLRRYYEQMSLAFPEPTDPRYEYRTSRSPNTAFMGNTDQDAWPNDEILHIDDFQEVLDQLSADPAVEEYFSDLLQTINERGSPAHGMPRVIVDTPARFIQRRRKTINLRNDSICKYRKPLVKDYFEDEETGAYGHGRQYSYGIDASLYRHSDWYLTQAGDRAPGVGHRDAAENAAVEFGSTIWWRQTQTLDAITSSDIRYYITPADGSKILMLSEEELEEVNNRIDPLRPMNSVIDVASGVPDAEKAMNQIYKLKPGDNAGPSQLLDVDHGHRGITMDQSPLDTTAVWNTLTDAPSNNRVHMTGEENTLLFSNLLGEMPSATYSEMKEIYGADADAEFHEETWSETIIDLRGDACPMYDSIGETCDTAIEAFEPDDELIRLFGALTDILGDWNRFERPGNMWGHGLLTFNGYTDRTRDDAPFPSCLFSVEGKPYISRPMGMIDRREFRTTTFSLHNAEMTVYDRVNYSSTGTIRNDLAEKRLLDLNDYLIPTRVAITQVASSKSGNIYETYCKFVTPEILEYIKSEGGGNNALKIRYLNKAIKAIIRDYICMIMDALDKDGRASENSNLINQEAQSRILSPGVNIERELLEVLKEHYQSIVIESPGFPVFEHAGGTPAELGWPTADWVTNSAVSKYNFISISKIYSKVFELYAEEESQLFSAAREHQDKIFDNPGYLLKNLNYIGSRDIDFQFTRNFLVNPDLWNSRPEHGFIGMAASVGGRAAAPSRFGRENSTASKTYVRNSAISKAEKRFRDNHKDYLHSMHWLYRYNLHDIFNQGAPPAESYIRNRIRLSLSNLMIWQKQERQESLWGQSFNTARFVQAWTRRHADGRQTVLEDAPPIKFVANAGRARINAGTGEDLGGPRTWIPATRYEELHSYKCGFSPFRADGRMNFLEARGYIYNNVDVWLKNTYSFYSELSFAESPISSLEVITKKDILDSTESSPNGVVVSGENNFYMGPPPMILAPFYPIFFFWRTDEFRFWKRLRSIGTRAADFLDRRTPAQKARDRIAGEVGAATDRTGAYLDYVEGHLRERMESNYDAPDGEQTVMNWPLGPHGGVQTMEGEADFEIPNRQVGLFRRDSIGYQIMLSATEKRLSRQFAKGSGLLAMGSRRGVFDQSTNVDAGSSGRYPSDYTDFYAPTAFLRGETWGAPAGHDFLIALSGRAGQNLKGLQDDLSGRYASFNVFDEDFEYLAKSVNNLTTNPLLTIRAMFSRMNITQDLADYSTDWSPTNTNNLWTESPGYARSTYNSLTDFFRKRNTWQLDEGQCGKFLDAADSKTFHDVAAINSKMDPSKGYQDAYGHRRPYGQDNPDSDFYYTGYQQSMLKGITLVHGFQKEVPKQIYYSGPNRSITYLRHLSALKSNTLLLAAKWDSFLSEAHRRLGPTSLADMEPENSISSIAQRARTSFWDATTGRLKALMGDSKIYQGIRLVHATPQSDLEETRNLAEVVKSSEIKTISKEERSFYMRAFGFKPQANPLAAAAAAVGSIIGDDAEDAIAAAGENFQEVAEVLTGKGADRDLHVFCTPLVSWEKEIDWTGAESSCWNMLNFKRIFNESELFRIRMLKEDTSKEDYELVLQYMFPIRTFMSMVTAFGSSALGNFSTMPALLSSTKSSLAYVYYVADTINNQAKSSAMDITSAELFKQALESSSSDGPVLDCFDFPFPKDFFKQFLEALGNLLKYLPSYIFRGIADKIDPMYKEMKVHWFACDIRNFNWFGVDIESTNWGGSGPTARKLKTGLKEDRTGNQKNKDGQYVPVNLGFPLDIAQTTLPLLVGDYRAFLGTMDKFLAYIYSGNLPWIDLSFAFEIPCLDADLSGEYDKFDIGHHGRYGHPLTPFTALAISTFTLPGEEKLRKKICIVREETPPECEDE